jgi:PKD repeat protein
VQFANGSTGDIAGYSWSFGDGGASSEASPSYTFVNPGTYTVDLTVAGAGGASSVQATITVDAPTATPEPTLVAAPIAAFTPSVTSGTAPLTVQFANGSTGDIAGYSWSFGDGGASSEASPSYTFVNPGTYTVDLTVAGAGGASSVQATITVDAPAETTPESTPP